MYDHGIRFIYRLDGRIGCYVNWKRDGESDVILTLIGDDTLKLKDEMEYLLMNVLRLNREEVENLNGYKAEA